MQASAITISLALFIVWLGAFALARHFYSRKRLRVPFHEDITAMGILALMVAGFFWRTIFEDSVFVPAGGGDLAAFLYPTFAFAASSIKQGILPLWNPYLYSGSPFAADIQSGLFYPINFFSISLWLLWPVLGSTACSGP